MLLPLAAIALFATSSIFGPASVLFRSIRRVVQPRLRAEPSEDVTVAAEAAKFLYTVFLRAFTSIVASVAQKSGSSSATLLPVFRDQAETSVSRGLHEETAPVNTPAVAKVNVVESASTSTAAAESDAAPIALQAARPQHRTQRVPLAPSACADFTIGWDDVWPQPQRCFPPPHVKYTFNSYYNAFTKDPVSPSHTLPELSFDSDTSSDDSDSDSDSDLDALELASRSADDDLLWAFHALSISDTPPSGAHPPCNSAFEPFPPAGLSPFCPPPPPTPNPPPTTTWRLEWY